MEPDRGPGDAKGFTLGLAYVANRTTRLPSLNNPLNALDPSLLSLGNALNDEFPGGRYVAPRRARALPGWREQMTSCLPRWPRRSCLSQYCSSLQGVNENEGKSTYHSLQGKIEKRFSGGTFLLVSYTFGKITRAAPTTCRRTPSPGAELRETSRPSRRSAIRAWLG